MPRPELASKEEIMDFLENNPLWVQDGKNIIRDYAASNFAAAVGIVNAIAVLAESADHHPDILIYGWNKVRIILSTHNVGGLTILDFNLASKIESLKF